MLYCDNFRCLVFKYGTVLEISTKFIRKLFNVSKIGNESLYIAEIPTFDIKVSVGTWC